MEFFFFALLFFSLLALLSVCSFLKTSHPFSSEKNSRASLSHQKSLSLSFSLPSVSFRESACFARVNRERERDFYLRLLCVLLLLLLCVGKRNRDTIDS